MKIEPRRSSAKFLLKMLVVVLVIGMSGFGVAYLTAQKDVQPKGTSVENLAPSVKSVSSRMLVMGDVFWGRYVNDWSMASEQKYAYPFQRLGEFERDRYDAWVADLECPVTNNPKFSSKEEDSTLKFDCSPDYLPEAKKWFTAFTLANNHTDNQGGQAGLAETRQHLDKNGIQYFGGFEPEDYDNLCNVLSIPARITMSDREVEQGRLPMVWCGYHGVFKTPSAQSVAVMKRYEAFNIVAMPHSGAEYQPSPDEIKTNFYRGLIDAGADVVLGDHPHWVQSTEAYKGKLIAYSLGNFIFDQQFSLEVTRSAVIDMEVSIDASESEDLDKWLTLGETCQSYADDCLTRATEQGLKKLPMKYHFKALGSRNDGRLVHRANDSELASIKQRLNWESTIKGLEGVNSGE